MGDITIIPFASDSKSEHFDELTALRVRTILASYKNIEGKPVRNAALVQYRSKPLLADLSDDELGITQDCRAIACFSALARRDYFNPLGLYCNADSFVFYGQRFQEKPEFAGITYRRLGERTIDFRSLERTTFSVPVHVSTISEVTLDEDLISSLVNCRDSLSEQEWARWQNALVCFNQANTDNESVSRQVEWVLLCSAFQRLLDARSDARDVAQKFVNVFTPTDSVTVNHAKRRSSPIWKRPTNKLSYEWMREFYALRGDFAHGRLQTHQSIAWNTHEHLVLACIAFPLVAKCLLVEAGKYTLSDGDYAQIDAFESFADEDFLQEPPDQQNSIDSWWNRHLMKAKQDHMFRRIANSLNTEPKS